MLSERDIDFLMYLSKFSQEILTYVRTMNDNESFNAKLNVLYNRMEHFNEGVSAVAFTEAVNILQETKEIFSYLVEECIKTCKEEYKTLLLDLDSPKNPFTKAIKEQYKID